MQTKFFALPIAVMAFNMAPAHAETASAKTQAFIEKAAISGQYEIEASKLALEKSDNAEVKKFADMMITDHTKASEALKAAVAASSLTSPTIPVSMDKDHNEGVAELKAKTGKDFNEEYIDEQEDAHDDAVALFKEYSKDGDNTVLKKFAADTLPTLEAHLKHVKTLDEKVD